MPVVASVFGAIFEITLELGRRKKPKMNCPNCGFEIDELNESQPVCPQCGTDPYDPNSTPGPLDDPLVHALAELGDLHREEAERKLYEEPASNLIN